MHGYDTHLHVCILGWQEGIYTKAFKTDAGYYTVKPLNKGHFESAMYSETSLIHSKSNTLMYTYGDGTIIFIERCLLFRGSFTLFCPSFCGSQVDKLRHAFMSILGVSSSRRHHHDCRMQQYMSEPLPPPPTPPVNIQPAPPITRTYTHNTVEPQSQVAF